MRRLKVFVAASVDGYIAGRAGDVSWRFRDADYGYEAFAAGIDTVLIGRRAYEAALSCERWPYPRRKVVVFRRGGEFRISSPDTVATSRAPADVVAELRTREGRDLWLAGGSELLRSCFDARMVDDVIVAIHPVIVGAGVPLFAAGTLTTRLTLVGERRYPSGVVQLAYRVDRDE